MQVDKSGRDDLAFGLQHLVGVSRIHLAANLGDNPILDPDVSGKPRDAGSVDDGPPANQNVEFGHCSLLSPVRSKSIQTVRK